MTSVKVLALMILLSDAAVAQVDSRPISAGVATSSELSMLFLRASLGKADPFIVIADVASRGDKILPLLDQIITMDSLQAEPATASDSALFRECLSVPPPPPYSLAKGQSAPDPTLLERQLRAKELRRVRVYALSCLEAIGSRGAYDLILSYAGSSPDADTRGMAINALATTFREDAFIQQAVPGKEILHVFLKNVDDIQSVPYLQRSIGELARKGLVTWLDYDTGEPQGKSARLLDAKGADRGSLADFREQWWLANEKVIAWDVESKMFIRK